MPNSDCLPTVSYFSREKPLVKSTAPGCISHIICLRDLFSFAFTFISIKPKTQKYLAAIYLIYCSIYQYLQLYHVRYPKGIDNPFYTSGCEYLLVVCRCYLHWLSYWFDNLGLITEGNTYRCYTASSLPLWGNTDVFLVDIKYIKNTRENNYRRGPPW